MSKHLAEVLRRLSHQVESLLLLCEIFMVTNRKCLGRIPFFLPVVRGAEDAQSECALLT